MEAVAGIDTRERIMRTTLELIGEEGIAAVTNRRVATAADISLGSLTENLAAAGLEVLQVPDAERHARSVVALLYGLALRRLGTGDEDARGTAEALLTIVHGARAGA